MKDSRTARPRPAAQPNLSRPGLTTPSDIFAGPGEMRTRCREFDWANTPLGPVEEWPQSLRTTVATLLRSRNPMFLWWGSDLIQFYNDAYRPSFGEGGRHPRALGMRGRDFWTDIWDTIGPQIEQVMSGGESTWHEDQYLPIERNGRLEDVWWTYSYSAVLDDGGAVGGTLVVCQETTSRIRAERERRQLLEETARAERRAARILEQISDEHLTMDAEFRILSVNLAAERALGTSKETLVGKTHWEAFPASAGTELERQYRRVASERVEAHVTHHYVGEGYDRHLQIDAYPTDEGGVALFWRDVSARVTAERALRESAARLRAIFDGTYEYIGLLAPDGTLLEANRASLEFIGRRRDEVIGVPFWDAPWFAFTAGATEYMRDAIGRAARGEFVRWEATLNSPAGAPTTFDISLHPIVDERGAVVLIVPEGRDITERVRSERARVESEERYRLLFDSLDEGFCVIEMIFDAENRPVDYRFIEANPAFVHQTGLHDAVGRTMRELAPGHEAHWFETYGQVARTGRPIRFEARAEALGRWYNAYAFKVGAPDEHKVAILFTDVSAAKAAEGERTRLHDALELERARLVEVFRRAPSFIVAFRGPELVYEFVNEAYYQLVGHREIIGKPLLDAIPEIRDQGFFEILSRVRETGESWVGRESPVELQRVPGAPLETRYLDMVFQALTEADGTRSGVVAHGSDVTEQVLARRQVERLLSESERARAEAEASRMEADEARVAAEGANRAKSDFLAVMSHELRTPLNAIGGYAELMELGIRGPVTPQQGDDLRRIQNSQRHLLGLINEVLNYAKLETGTVHYEVNDVRIREVLISAEALVAPQARAKGLALAIGDCPPDFTARADHEKVRQILTNLLSNAVKFTDRGGRIAVTCDALDTRIFVRVTDSGIGIPPDKLKMIFDPFVQVRADLTRQHEGTGLGLAISRDLARGMGGDLTVESTLGSGSSFTVILPKA